MVEFKIAKPSFKRYKKYPSKVSQHFDIITVLNSINTAYNSLCLEDKTLETQIKIHLNEAGDLIKGSKEFKKD